MGSITSSQNRLDAMFLAKEVENLLRPMTDRSSHNRFWYHSGFGGGFQGGGPLSDSRAHFSSRLGITRPNIFLGPDKTMGLRSDIGKGFSSMRLSNSPSVESSSNANRNRGIRRYPGRNGKIKGRRRYVFDVVNNLVRRINVQKESFMSYC